MRAMIMLAAGLLCVVAACEEPGGKILELDATGVVSGIAYLDRNGDEAPTLGVDAAVPNVRIFLTTPGGTTTVASATADSAGVFHVRDVPVGRYRVVAESPAGSDTISVSRVDSAHVTVTALDTAVVLVTLSYATSPIADLSQLPLARRIALNATVLNTWPTFGDSTIHFADSTATIRAVGVRPVIVNLGDRVRLIATLGERDGQRVLTDVTFVSALAGELPTPTDVSTAEADTAGGKLNAGLVRIRNATVLDASSLTGGDVLLTVDDQSGPLEILIDANANIATALPISRGAELDVTGLLVPHPGTNTWRLKPRRSEDVTVRYPPVSIATARTRQRGQFVVIEGIALNDMSNFGDLTLHVKDATGTMRVIGARPAFVSAGDSVSVLGAVAAFDGQPVLNGAVPSVIARRVPPTPDSVTTGRAANADDGKLDAALVRIADAALIDSDTIGAEIRLTVNDSSGLLIVILDPDASINAQIRSLPARVEVIGVLVPIGARVWALKPRTSLDIRVF